jgi:ABC-type polysaccharide/polyol phosphate export permease
MGRYRFLFEQLVRRELRRKYQGSVLGIAWYVVNPLVLMGAYYLLFGVLFPPAQIEDFPLFLMVGLVIWLFFAQSLLGAASSLLDQGSLIRKARFPRETLPAAVVTVQFVTFAVLLALVAVVVFAVRGTIAPPLVLLPFLLAALYAFTLGLALAVAVLHAYFRDVAPILSAVLLPWFFLSPIFFRPDDVTRDHQWAADLLTWANPIAPFIESVRDVVYAGAWPDGFAVLYVVGIALFALAGGLALFRRLQGELAVVV